VWTLEQGTGKELWDRCAQGYRMLGMEEVPARRLKKERLTGEKASVSANWALVSSLGHQVPHWVLSICVLSSS
jgi:hypothetical protein